MKQHDVLLRIASRVAGYPTVGEVDKMLRELSHLEQTPATTAITDGILEMRSTLTS